jgi:hypothetical protein
MTETTFNYRNQAEVRAKGLEALTDTLGTVGTVYFLRLFSNGSGNWTEDRKELLADMTEEDFEKELSVLRQNQHS